VAYSPTLDELRDAIDSCLAASLDSAEERLPEAKALVDEIRRVVTAGGKRIRPAFCYWGYRASGGATGEPILCASAGLELLHTFAIVHDDIMDASDLRRGAPTINALHGPDVALLAGDLALVLADDELMSSGFSGDELTGAFRAYSRMRQEVVAGQYLELEIASGSSISEEAARRVAVLKSGRYSIREPLLIGATLAGAPRALEDALAGVGESLGEAFQLADDLLGTFGEGSVTGKPVDSDVRSGKKHVLFAKTAAALEGRELAVFLAKWGGGDALDDADVDELRGFIESSGARRSTETLLDELAGDAMATLEKIDVPDDAREALVDLAESVTRRSR
jgi:geranylgeranyl diphosphate synthase, type I